MKGSFRLQSSFFFLPNLALSEEGAGDISEVSVEISKYVRVKFTNV